MKKQCVFWSVAVLAALAIGATGCGGSSDGCPGDLSKCDGECVDTTTDRSHCGACGTTCPNGQLCVAGSCTPCNNQCTQGQKECVDDTSFRLCQMDANTCWVWGPAQQCAGGLVCDGDGQCVEGCADQCSVEGDTVCTQDGTGYRICGQYDADDCLDLSSPVPCGAGYACEDGKCVESCSDECTTAGDRQCSLVRALQPRFRSARRQDMGDRRGVQERRLVFNKRRKLDAGHGRRRLGNARTLPM